MLKKLTKDFARDEEGATVIEYLIIIALVAIFAIILFKPLRQAVADWFNGMIKNVNNALSGNPTDGENIESNAEVEIGW